MKKALYCTETTGNTLAIQFQLKSVRVGDQ